MNEAFNKKLETLTGQMSLLKVGFEEVVIVIGKEFVPLILKGITKLKGMVDAVMPWVKANKKLLATLMGVGAGGAGLIFALSSIGFLLPGLITLFAALSGPIGVLIIAATALAGAFIWLATKNKEATTQLGEFIKEQEKVSVALSDTEEKLLANKTETEEMTDRAEELRKKVAEEKDEMGPYHRLLEQIEDRLIDNIAETENLTTAKEGLLAAQKELQVSDIDAMLMRNQEEYAKLTSQVEYYRDAQDNANVMSARGGESLMMMHGEAAKTERALKANVKETEELVAARESLIKQDFVGPLQSEAGAIESVKDATSAAVVVEKDILQVIRDTVAAREAKNKADRWAADLIPELAAKNMELGEEIGKVATGSVEMAELSNAALDAFMEKSKETAEVFEDSFKYALEGVGGMFFSMFETIYTHEKNFLKAFSAAFGLTIVNTISNAIKGAVAELILFKIKEVGKAAMAGFFAPWMWAQIPLIAAAGATAVAGMKALAGKFKPKPLTFEGGLDRGPVPYTGYHLLHKDELVFNPDRNNQGQLAAALGGGAGEISVRNSFFGPLNTEIDLNEAGIMMGRAIRRVLGG